MLSANAWHSRSACLTTVAGTAICCYPQTANSLLPQFAPQFQPESVIARLMSPMASGRYLALSDGTDTSATFTEAVRHYNCGVGRKP
jgi:hypothetical protein